MGNLSLKKFTQFALVLALVYLGVSYLPDILGFGGNILDAASPLIWGCVIAYVLNILMVRLEALYFPKSNREIIRKSRRLVCILLAFVILMVILLLVINIVLPELVSSIDLIVKEIPLAGKNFVCGGLPTLISCRLFRRHWSRQILTGLPL